MVQGMFQFVSNSLPISAVFNCVDLDRRYERGWWSFLSPKESCKRTNSSLHLESGSLIDDDIDQALSQQLPSLVRQFMGDEHYFIRSSYSIHGIQDG